MIVLDSSVLSMVFRRHPSPEPHPATRLFRSLVERDNAMAIPGVVLQEVLSGVKTTEGFRRLEAALSGFPLLIADRATHLRAARVHNACRAAGISAASLDCLVAAHALATDAELFTLDRDFTHMSKAVPLRLVAVHP